jgi:hypothetical protein
MWFIIQDIPIFWSTVKFSLLRSWSWSWQWWADSCTVIINHRCIYSLCWWMTSQFTPASPPRMAKWNFQDSSLCIACDLVYLRSNIYFWFNSKTQYYTHIIASLDSTLWNRLAVLYSEMPTQNPTLRTGCSRFAYFTHVFHSPIDNTWARTNFTSRIIPFFENTSKFAYSSYAITYG